ncbi:MAG: hypothetical protein HKN24_02580 [Acidimicrobiales bacterium]|nr:hypothetical protein [Acidimicrobiales bacterium]
MTTKQDTEVRNRARRRVATMLTIAVACATIAAGVAQAAGNSRVIHRRADVMVQGGGDVYQSRGAYLQRMDHSLEVWWSVKTPESGSYVYPTPDMVPPGAPPHPPLEPGDDEVFTLWLFVFDNPELCSDGVCDGDDVGNVGVGGSVYQVDGEIAYRTRLRMSGKVRLGQAAANGPGLSNPLGAEVHVAMAPHGAARDGADLIRQLNSPVGNPTLWWAALFLP